MNKTIVTHLKNKDQQIVGIRVKTNDDEFDIPIVDVRHSEAKRIKAKAMMKAANAQRGSKFIGTAFSGSDLKYN